MGPERTAHLLREISLNMAQALVKSLLLLGEMIFNPLSKVLVTLIHYQMHARKPIFLQSRL